MTGIEIGLITAAMLLGFGFWLLVFLRLELWWRARRARNARADAAIDAMLRERFPREVHGLTVPQLLDLVDIELDLDADGDLRRRIDDLNNQFPNP